MFTNEYFSDWVSAWTGGRGVSQMQTAAERGEGGGGVKITENMQISFMNGPSEVFLIDLVLLSLQYL